MDDNIGAAPKRNGKWTVAELGKLKEAVEKHGEKNWAVVAALVPGQTIKQCAGRWKVLDPKNSSVHEKGA